MTPDEMKALIAEAREANGNGRVVGLEVIGLPSHAGLIYRLADALEAAQDWKSQAMTVLSEWEATYEAAGSSGRLGQSKAVALREEIERLRALSAHPAEETGWEYGRRHRETGRIAPLRGKPFPSWWGESQAEWEHVRRPAGGWSPVPEGSEAV